MNDKKKPVYNMWQSTGFLLREAWKVRKSTIFFCVLMAVITSGVSVVELLIAPMILKKIEVAAPFGELLGTIGLFSVSLLLLTGLKGYLQQNMVYTRTDIRKHLMVRINEKAGDTSYPNMLNTKFRDYLDNAQGSCFYEDGPLGQTFETLTVILTNLIGFVIYLLLLTGLHPWLFLVVIVTSVVGYLINRRFIQQKRKYMDEGRSPRRKMHYTNGYSTNRTNAKDIRIFALRPWLEDAWDSALRLYQVCLSKAGLQMFLAALADLVLVLLRSGVAYGYLIWLTLTEGLPASTFLLYFGVATGFTQWITGIMEKFSTLHEAGTYISQLMETLNWPEPFRFEDGKPLPTERNEAYELRLEHVSYRYPGAEKDTIRGIDLTIHPGEKVAIVGLNGAGKTTLVRLLCGFLDPTEGRVLLNGEDIRQYNRRDYYALFTAVFQDFSILEASAAENIAQQVEGIDISRVWECLRLAGLDEKFRQLPQGLDTKIGRRVYKDGIELSGGQTQRLMLARALYKNAPLLVLDEPTAALDPIAEDDIYRKYSAMTDGRTSLFISHRLASTRFCDRILFMKDGKIAEEGTHETLLALGGGYAELFRVQSRYYQEGGEADGKTE